MNMSNHVEFDAPQTSDLEETMAKRMLEDESRETVGEVSDGSFNRMCFPLIIICVKP